MQRTLQPELLDSLPPDDPAAAHNRRDLRLTNRIVGNHRWLARVLPPLIRNGEVALELGAGTGELGRALAKQGIAVDGIDRWPRPADWPAARAWHPTDLRSFTSYDRYPVALGNLIFHHFSDPELADLGGKLCRSARVVIACEPARRRLSQFLFRTLAPLFGAHAITLHDAQVSINAGFRDEELPRALGLDRAQWQIRVTTSALGLYRMVAVRRA